MREAPCSAPALTLFAPLILFAALAFRPVLSAFLAPFVCPTRWRSRFSNCECARFHCGTNGRNGWYTMAPAVEVTVRDFLGSVVTGFAGDVTVAVGTNPGGGTLSGTMTLAATSGVVNFTDLSIVGDGSGYDLTASTAAPGLIVTSSGFDVHPAPLVYVGNYQTVSAISAATNTVLATIDTDGLTTGVATTPDGTSVYVTNRLTNSVSAISTETNVEVANVGVGNWPQAVLITPDGTQVYVPNRFDQSVSVVSTETNTVLATVEAGNGPGPIAITPWGPDGSR